MHEELTEIYQIIEGSGTLLTGGTMTDLRPVADPPNLGPTESYFCTMVGGVSQKVMPKDVIIVAIFRTAAFDGGRVIVPECEGAMRRPSGNQH